MKLSRRRSIWCTAAAAGKIRLALVTAHRRESWGEPLDRVLRAVRRLLDRYPDLWVVLPKVFNGKDKLFFFADYEGKRVRQAQTFLSSVPTAAFQAGNFSSLLPKTVILDPRSATFSTLASVYRAVGLSLAGLRSSPR